MPLIECPDCGRKVSDRAKNCPDCACPVSEVIAELRAAEARDKVAATRALVTERLVDCRRCSGRGWFSRGDGMVAWCIVCEHTGRTPLCRASDGFYSVAPYAVERFLAGELHAETSGVVFALGETEPRGHAFADAADRVPVASDNPSIPWVIDPEEKNKI